MRHRSIAAAAAALLLAGCAIHPVPEDVTGVDTYHIVRQIRCETREAAAAFVIRELRNLAAGGETQPGNPIAQRIVADYDRDAETISDFKPEVFAGPEYAQVRNFYKLIYTTGVAYSFDLTMTEDNNLNATANFVGPWNPATFTLGLGSNANLQRQNERQFTVTDTLGPLLTDLNRPVRGKRYCDGQIRIANYAYPIAGHIGVDKMVKTFFELSLFANLAAQKDAVAGAPPSMADKLTFTTLVDLSVMPKVVFTPVTSGFQPSEASLNGVARRTDAHQVIVGLALDNKAAAAALGPLRGYLFSRQRSEGVTIASGTGARVLLASSVTAHVATPAQQLAVLAVDQLKNREVQLLPAR